MMKHRPPFVPFFMRCVFIVFAAAIIFAPVFMGMWLHQLLKRNEWYAFGALAAGVSYEIAAIYALCWIGIWFDSRGW